MYLIFVLEGGTLPPHEGVSKCITAAWHSPVACATPGLQVKYDI